MGAIIAILLILGMLAVFFSLLAETFGWGKRRRR